MEYKTNEFDIQLNQYWGLVLDNFPRWLDSWWLQYLKVSWCYTVNKQSLAAENVSVILGFEGDKSGQGWCSASPSLQ